MRMIVTPQISLIIIIVYMNENVSFLCSALSLLQCYLPSLTFLFIYS